MDDQLIDNTHLRSRSRSHTRSSSVPIRLRRLEGTRSVGSSPARDECTTRKKCTAIRNILDAEEVDVNRLKQFAISRGGLLNDELRVRAWPKLLGLDPNDIPTKPDVSVLHGHRDYNQVVLDVNRSVKRFPPGMEEEVRLGYQDQLIDVIMWVLVNNPDLHYYQGYHDITVTFLLVVGEDLTFLLLNYLSKHHLRDFMDADMERTKYILNYLYPIIGKANQELRDHMEKSEAGTIFALSWLITWYGHVLNEFCHIVRLYDFFIACHPLMPIYLAAAIVLFRQKEVLQTEPEMCMMHCILSKIPQDLPFELLAARAGDLFLQYPPDQLKHQAEIEFKKSQMKLAETKAQSLASRKTLRKPSKQPWLQRCSKLLGSSIALKFTMWSIIIGLLSLTIGVMVRSGNVSWMWNMSWPSVFDDFSLSWFSELMEGLLFDAHDEDDVMDID